MRIRRLLPTIIALLGLVGCAPTEISYPALTNLPVLRDPRPMYVLFSWTIAGGAFRFALIRDRPTIQGEIGAGRNAFLDRFDLRRTSGFDLASLEKELKVLPTSSLVDWFIDDGRHLSLPPAPVVQRIKGLISRRKATLNLDNIKDWMS
jgi:hypothetical protein